MFPLLRYFSITSAIVLVAVIVLLVVVHRELDEAHLIEMTQHQNVALARSFANSVWPRHSDFLASMEDLEPNAIRESPKTQEISKALEQLSSQLPVLKYKIYNLRGRTIFSSDASEIGVTQTDNPAFLAAERSGRPISKLRIRRGESGGSPAPNPVVSRRAASGGARGVERDFRMAANKKLLMLPGDGIGPEVMAQVRRVIEWMDKRRHVGFDVAEDLVGGCAIDAHGTSLSEDTMAAAMAVDAVLLGAVGGPKWDHVGFDIRPEAGLLRLRKDMELFANLRPALVFDALADASSLKTELVAGLDILIVRELTGGVYFGEPRGIEELPDGQRRGVNTQVYTTSEIERVARVAFDLARKRGNRLCSVEKSNVMESGVLWREEVTKIGATEFAEIELSHMLADNCAMQLVRNPKQFDVIVTDNLFGDMLSDVAAMLTGSLGMLPSASLGAADSSGRRRALYEPVHGSAPDIAGADKANPLAMLLSYSMMLRYSFDMEEDAELVERAVENVLDAGLRTGDIMQPGKIPVSTTEMAAAVIAELDTLAA